MRSLLPFAGAVTVAYGVLCAWVFFTQIKVWTLPRPGGRALLYFGGNERISTCSGIRT